MDATNRITIDVSDPLTTHVIKAVQEDNRSRFVEITLVSNGEPLSIPVGASGMIGLRRPNGTYVLYDEDDDGNKAVTFDGNVATAYLSQEALALAGELYTSVSIYTSSQRLTAFHFVVAVEETAVPSGVVVETDYFNILEGLVEDAVDAAARADAALAALTSASTTQAGIVQLVDGIASTSVTMAPTANAMRMLEPRKLLFTNKTVQTTDFVLQSPADHADYPYRAAVALTGVESGMIPEVIFSVEDATGGGFAPCAESYFGGIYIYAMSAPEAAVTIPTIILWGANA